MADSSDGAQQRQHSGPGSRVPPPLPAPGHSLTGDQLVEVAAPPEGPLCTDDYRSLIHVSSARMACFDFERSISMKLSTADFIAALYNTPSRCLEGSLPFAASTGCLTVNEILGRPLATLLPEARGYLTLFERWHRLSGSGQSFEVEVLDPSGEPVVLQSVVYARQSNGSFSRLWCILRDVTVHARAVSALANAERHYRSLVERPGLFLLRIRPDESYEYVSPGLEQIIGHSVAALRKNPDLFYQRIHPEDIAHYDLIREARRNCSSAPIEAQIRLRMQDGSYHGFFVRQSAMTSARSVTANSVSANGVTANRAKVHSQTRPSEIEYFDLVAVDIQSHKELELELERGARVALVGQLASGIAHDFNNHLMAILGQLNLGLDLLEQKHPAYTAFESAKGAVSACSHMAKQLLNVGRGTAPAVKAVTLNNVVLDAVALVGNLVPSCIELTVSTDKEPLVALGDEVQLQQAVINLVLNARDALSSGGKISVSVSECPPNTLCDSAAVGQRFAQIMVKDTGAGLDPTVVARLFQPFVTTKTTRGGSGLGLSMVKMIAEAHQGRVQVSSTPQAGTCFSVFIPLQQYSTESARFPPSTVLLSAAAPPETSLAQPQHLVATRSVLIAEDDEVIRTMLGSALTSLGYTVSTFANGPLLLDHLAVNGTSCDVIIVDDSMPRVRGLHMLEQLRALLPKAHLILTSGDPTVAREPQISKFGAKFLAKPYPLTELISAVC